MRFLFSLIAILALAFLGHRLPARLSEGPARRVVRFFSQGAGLILFGILLGPMGTGFIDEEILLVLAPLKVLTLAWIGLLFGLQFDRSLVLEGRLKGLAGLSVREGLGTGLITAAFCTPWVLAMAGLVEAGGAAGGGNAWRVVFPCLLIIASLASCSTFYESRDSGALRVMRKWPVCRFLQFAAGADQLTGILLLWVLTGVIPSGNRVGGGISGLLIPVVLGAAAGFLIALLASRKVGRQERLTIAMGGILLVSGVALNMGLPILLVSSLVGMVVANASPGRSRLAEELHPAERPLFLIMLLLIGTSWRPGHWGISLGLALTYVMVRAGAKMGLVWLFTRRIRGDQPWIGAGLLHQGALPLALLIDSAWFLNAEIADTVVTAMLMGILMSDGLGAASMSRIASFLGSRGSEKPLAGGGEK